MSTLIVDDAPKARGLYLFRCGAHYKIGHSRDVARRLAAIQAGNPYKVEFVAARLMPEGECEQEEEFWHIRFAAERAEGEWFKLSHEQVEEFKNGDADTLRLQPKKRRRNARGQWIQGISGNPHGRRKKKSTLVELAELVADLRDTVYDLGLRVERLEEADEMEVLAERRD